MHGPLCPPCSQEPSPTGCLHSLVPPGSQPACATMEGPSGSWQPQRSPGLIIKAFSGHPLVSCIPVEGEQVGNLGIR